MKSNIAACTDAVNVSPALSKKLTASHSLIEMGDDVTSFAIELCENSSAACLGVIQHVFERQAVDNYLHDIRNNVGFPRTGEFVWYQCPDSEDMPKGDPIPGYQGYGYYRLFYLASKKDQEWLQERLTEEASATSTIVPAPAPVAVASSSGAGAGTGGTDTSPTL